MCVKCGENKCTNTSTCSGSIGRPGTPGNDGVNGNTILTGSGAPAAGLGVDGDVYVDIDNGDIYTKKITWQLDGNFSGTNGNDGADGNSITAGAGIPAIIAQNEGDLHIDTATGDLYELISGAWVLQGNIIGPVGPPGTNGSDGVDGDDGLSFRQGTGVPLPGLGIDGDSYVDNDNFDVYVKSAGVWNLTGNLTTAAVAEEYLFYVSKTDTQAFSSLSLEVDTDKVKICQVPFFNEEPAPLFDHGDNWHSASYVAPIDLTNVMFVLDIDFEFENVLDIGVAPSFDEIHIGVDILCNGVVKTNDLFDVFLNNNNSPSFPLGIGLQGDIANVTRHLETTLNLSAGDVVTVDVVAEYDTSDPGTGGGVRDSYPVRITGGRFYNIQLA